MEKVTIEAFKVIGIAVRTTNENGKGVQDIGALWQKFMSEGIITQIPNKLDNTIYSLYTDYEGDYTKPYTSMIGCKVENLDIIPDGMIGKAFHEANYVKFTTRGDLSKDIIAKEWFKIWKTDLDRTYSVDFEVFGEKAKNPEDAEIDIFIGVK